MIPTICIRRADPSDAEAIGRARVGAWRAAYRDFMPPEYLAALDPAANLDGLRELISGAAPLPVVTVAEVVGVNCGFSLLGASRAPREGCAHELWALNVLPTYWRQGVARALVERSLADARAAGAREVELWCIAGNEPAQSLYRRCGFEATGEQRTTTQLTGLPLTEDRFVARIAAGA